jgi:dienelactone hydrolase
MTLSRLQDLGFIALAMAWPCFINAAEFGNVRRDKHASTESHSGFWVYHIEGATESKRPCVLVAAAGSRLFHGIKLTEEDCPEHLPYAKAGFVVIAYDVSGPLSENAPDRAVFAACRLFKEAEGGVRDGLAALEAAEKKYKFIDPDAVYVAGHSSAGTIAFAVAQKSERVKGCVAYAPVCDPHSWIGKEMLSTIESGVPGFEKFLAGYSPKLNTRSLKCPVFIFHAEDDPGVLPAVVDEYVSRLKVTNKSVTHVKVKDGGHYDSMIAPGLSKGVAWLGELRTKTTEPGKF